jgi:hypothetical protein
VSGPTRNAILLAGGALAFAGLAELSLWILPVPHQPFHYLLAGTLATAVTLAAMLALASLRGAFPEVPGAALRGRVVRLRIAPDGAAGRTPRSSSHSANRIEAGRLADESVGPTMRPSRRQI